MNKHKTLSTGRIREIMTKHTKPPNPLVLQILETKVFRNDNFTYYDMYLSDGDLGMIFSNNHKFNRLHSTGKLSVFTIIEVDKYEFEFHDNGSSFQSDILSFKIIANGRDVKKIIGSPTNLTQEMRTWLNLFTIRLEKETILKQEDSKLKLTCLNSSTNISKLSTGCLQKICYGDKIEKPIVQILSLVKIINAEENLIYYSVDISDGKKSFHRVETQSFHFNNLVEAGFIDTFSIIRLDKYSLFENETRLKVTNVTVINKDVTSQIGETLEPVKLLIFDYRLRDKLLKDMKMAGKKMTLDAASLVDIQRGVSFLNPVVQIVNFNKYDRLLYNFEISDGVFRIFTEFMDEKLTEGLLTLKFTQNAIVKIDKYELSFVKDTYEQYKPIVHIIKLHFLTNPDKIYKGLFGEPSLTDIDIPMVHKDYECFEVLKSLVEPKNSKPEKSFLKKGFLNKPADKVVTPKEEDFLFFTQKTELDKQLRSLNIKLKDGNKNVADFKKCINTLESENAQLMKKLENKKKTQSIKLQKLIENNLEISGIQQKPNEDLRDIVDRIFTLLSVSLNFYEDITITRGSHEILLVKCKNTEIKKKILNRMHGKKLHTEELYLNLMKRSIFINEQLTHSNKLIFLKAKALRKNKVFDNVWITNGHVMVKSKSDGNKSVHIYSMEQLNKYCVE